LDKKDLPVYMFTGLLESGKTSFIRDTLNDGEFEDGEKSVYILCEEGEVEIDPELLRKNLITVVKIEERELFTEDYLNQIEEKYRPDRILLEVNGMWKPNDLVDEFPENWMLVQCIALIDGSTFKTYMNNMGSFIMEQVKPADLVVFNKVDDNEDRGSYRRRVKALNRRAQILYEDEKGNLDDAYADTMPFPIDGPVIELPDDDFGLWYMDAMDHPEKYVGKKIKFHAMVYRGKGFPDDKLVPGRFAMTCCAADIQYVGYVCHAPNAKDFGQKAWVNVEADVKYEYCKDYKGKGIVLYSDKDLEAAEPGEQLVYFT
jgi:hypothetical protein